MTLAVSAGLTQLTDLRYAYPRISHVEAGRLKTFGRIIADARKALGISQKELAANILKEDRASISPQYLNDIEHDRRNPPSEFMIEQFATHLTLSKEHLIAAAGLWPTDLRNKLAGTDPKRVEKAFTAFRKVLKDKT